MGENLCPVSMDAPAESEGGDGFRGVSGVPAAPFLRTWHGHNVSLHLDEMGTCSLCPLTERVTMC